MEERRRIGAYGVCRDGGRVLLVRGSAPVRLSRGVAAAGRAGSSTASIPSDAVVREFAEETGLTVDGDRAPRPRVADVPGFPDAGSRCTPTGSSSTSTPRRRDASRRRGRPAPPTLAAWCHPAEAAGAAADAVHRRAARACRSRRCRARTDPADARSAPAPTDRRQRFGAYGLVTDPAGRVLLTMIADGLSGRRQVAPARRRHRPRRAARRRAAPRAGRGDRPARPGRRAAGRRQPAQSRRARPGGAAAGLAWRAGDLPGAWCDAPTEPVVTESPAGRPPRAAWFDPDAGQGLPLTDVAALATGRPGR